MSKDPRNKFHLTTHISQHLNKISHPSQLMPIALGVSRKRLLHWSQNISNDINKKVGPLSEQWNSPTLFLSV
ncbi:TPR_REGION domain-containing protein [Psidium guajava]|nr:TPR_REGION domain-containing protein [Psidium guajava]